MSILDKIFRKGKAREEPAVDKSVLLDKIRQSELFKNLPPENIEKMFSHMETVHMSQGDTVIREGDEGDYYYLLVSGKATVTRRDKAGGKPQVLAELNEPKGFGEEALISNAKRNATITMTAPGTVMRLSKDAFNEQVKDPLVTWLSPMQAQDKIAKGARWIDVRDAGAAQQKRLRDAITIPIQDLRQRLSELSKDIPYICYCENGRMSSTAAFVMRQQGFDASVLRGGLSSLQRAGVT